MFCSCDSQELWQWLSDHPKWAADDVGSTSNRISSGFNDNAGDIGNSVSGSTSNSYTLKCEQPNGVRGKFFLQMQPREFCDEPLIVKVAIQDIQPFSVLVSWQGRENSGITGFQVIYQSLDNNYEVNILYFYLFLKIHLINSKRIETKYFRATNKLTENLNFKIIKHIFQN